jgi:heptosyltransferase-2
MKQKKILVIRYRFLGDTILTVPFLKKLREAEPEAFISVLIGPQSGELLKNCPYINELIEFDTTNFHKYESGKKKKKSLWENAQELKKKNFDVAYVLKRSLSSALLVWLAAIEERIGFDTEFRGFFLTKKIPFDIKKSEVINFLEHLPPPFNRPPAKDEVFYWPTEEEDSKAKKLILAKGLNHKENNILIHAPSAHPLKMWAKERWAELLKTLHSKNYKLIFSGAPQDNAYYEELIKLSGVHPDINLCTEGLSLRENIAVYRYCALAVCVDSGPMHLAAALQVPLVGIFGPTDPVRWQPWSDKATLLSAPLELTCRPCNLKPTCKNFECLNELSAGKVFEIIEQKLKENN